MKRDRKNNYPKWKQEMMLMSEVGSGGKTAIPRPKKNKERAIGTTWQIEVGGGGFDALFGG